MKTLGVNQLAVFNAVKKHGCWFGGCGWIWSTRSQTIRILDSLVKRKLLIVSLTNGITKYVLS